MAGSPFHKDDEAAPISDVNVVPLADVSLVLLIILLVLAVTDEGFVMDGRLLPSASALTAFLKQVLQPRTDRKIFVSPQLETAHGQVVAALEAVQSAGGTVALVQIADPGAR